MRREGVAVCLADGDVAKYDFRVTSLPVCQANDKESLQLLCGACNSLKGEDTQAELKAKLKKGK